MAQDVFRSVAAHLGQFRRLRPGDTFRGWLWTITKNKLRDHFRREKVRPETIGGSEAQRLFAEKPDSDFGDEPPDDSASVTEERPVRHRVWGTSAPSSRTGPGRRTGARRWTATTPATSRPTWP